MQGLKKDVIDLNKDLFVLEEELLFPANTQVAVYVSMDVGTFFALDSVTVKIDNKEVKNYLYTAREADALLKGGVQQIYLGNLKVGKHEMVAFFTGKGPDGTRLPARRHDQLRQGRWRQVSRTEDHRQGSEAPARVHDQELGMMRRGTVLRMRYTLRPIFLGGLLLALPPAAGAAKYVKPDPNGLPPHEVKDLHYGDVLFYYYQDDYFDSITRLLAAQQLDRLPHTEGEAQLLLGGLYLSLGEHVEAGKIFEALLAGKTSEAVRNKAWFYLGKVWYQRGYLEESERALRQVSDKIQPRINAERYMLLAQLMLRQGRYDDAIKALSSWRGAPDWTAYAQFNLGVALVRKGRVPEAIAYLNRVGRMETADEELLSLRDKANLALGFALLQAKRPTEAKPILERVRLEGPYSSMALLGVGWADSSVGEFKRALVPWLALRKRNLLDSAVQESYLTVPYAFNQLGASGQAAEYYNSAIESYDAELTADQRFDRADTQRQPARPAVERRQEGHAHLVLAAQDAARTRRNRGTCTSCSPAMNSRKG